MPCLLSDALTRLSIGVILVVYIRGVAASLGSAIDEVLGSARGDGDGDEGIPRFRAIAAALTKDCLVSVPARRGRRYYPPIASLGQYQG